MVRVLVVISIYDSNCSASGEFAVISMKDASNVPNSSNNNAMCKGSRAKKNCNVTFAPGQNTIN